MKPFMVATLLFNIFSSTTTHANDEWEAPTKNAVEKLKENQNWLVGGTTLATAIPGEARAFAKLASLFAGALYLYDKGDKEAAAFLENLETLGEHNQALSSMDVKIRGYEHALEDKVNLRKGYVKGVMVLTAERVEGANFSGLDSKLFVELEMLLKEREVLERASMNAGSILHQSRAHLQAKINRGDVRIPSGFQSTTKANAEQILRESQKMPRKFAKGLLAIAAIDIGANLWDIHNQKDVGIIPLSGAVRASLPRNNHTDLKGTLVDAE